MSTTCQRQRTPAGRPMDLGSFAHFGCVIAAAGGSAGRLCVLAFWLVAGSHHAVADGGVVRARETVGPFVLTVFTAPATLVAGPVEVSVLVQRRDLGEAVLDADVELQFVPPPGVMLVPGDLFCGPNGMPVRANGTGVADAPRVIQATHVQAANRLLYAATVELPTAGAWRMRVRVRQPDASAGLECSLPVITAHAGWVGIWPYLAIPLVLAGLFAVHQALKQRATRPLHQAL